MFISLSFFEKNTKPNAQDFDIPTDNLPDHLKHCLAETNIPNQLKRYIAEANFPAELEFESDTLTH